MLEKTEKFISKSANKVEKEETEETLTKPEPDNFKSKNFSIKDNTPHHLIPIVESLSIYSDSGPEGNSENLVSNKDRASHIKIITISSHLGSETEIEGLIFIPNKNSLSRVTEIRSLGKNEVKSVNETH